MNAKDLHLAVSAMWISLAIVVFIIGRTFPAEAQVDQQRAQQYFKEVQSLCERDAGRLWGVSLCGPMVIGDVQTQTFATSQPAPSEARPQVIGIVNAPIQWGGISWGAYAWEFVVGTTPRRRRELFIHELFHGVEPQLGLIVPALATEHLDELDGRYWLRLEWRALARALRESGAQRNVAVSEALAFRETRRRLYPGSTERERASEITEGLAAYTGTVIAAESTADATASAVDQLAEAEVQESFVRTFAYASGPAYGLLLDTSSDGWRRKLRPTDDLATLLMNALSVQPAMDATLSATRYGGAELRDAEQQREQQRQQRVAELRRRFVDGPVLIIPAAGGGNFDSRGAVAISGVGTVYFGAFRSSGEWGTLVADTGVLVTSDGISRRVSAPVRRADGTYSGDGWTFKAAAGWIVREAARRGDYEVVRR